jgi:hypothetical protein
MISSTSWLFVRGGESVRVVRSGQGIIVLSVQGPGTAKAVYAFDDVGSSQDYLVRLQNKLLAARWSFEGPNAERRSGIDRRASSRTSLERRRSW